jgi:hypothetical protein
MSSTSPGLPPHYPTQGHAPAFWEALGRTVATYGFLEEALGKAIFAFTGTREIPEEQAQAVYEKWLPKLEKALSDALGALIDSYGKAVRSNSSATITNLDELLTDLREAAAIRNVLCHGSWNQLPDEQGRSIPFYINRKQEKWEGPVDIAFLEQAQRHVLELTCDIINSVTHMGWQFPGSTGPGKVLWPAKDGVAGEGRELGRRNIMRLTSRRFFDSCSDAQ